MYPPELYEVVKKTCQEYNYFFNYADFESGRAENGTQVENDPETAFHKYDGTTAHDEAMIDAFANGYKKQNAAAIAKALEIAASSE